MADMRWLALAFVLGVTSGWFALLTAVRTPLRLMAAHPELDVSQLPWSSLLALLTGDGDANDVGGSRGPRFRLVSTRRQHLPLVVRAFEKLGFEEDSSSTPTMTDVWRWDVAWSFQYPKFDQTYGPMLPHTRVNHLRGNAALTRKQDLFPTFSAARDEFSAALFDFVPEHFLIPEQMEGFAKAQGAETETEAQTTLAAAGDEAAEGGDEHFGKRWIAKSRNHGGIKLVQGSAEVAALKGSASSMVSKYVEPLLVDGHKWDIGMYVLVASLSPLRVYVHSNALVRLCLGRYPARLDSSAEAASYVVKDYAAPWDSPSLQARYARHGAALPGEGAQGRLHPLVMCEQMQAQGAAVTCARWWEGMRAAAVKMLLHVTPSLRRLARQTSRFDTSFELFRMDFNTDHFGKPWLVEVNMSPNLLPKRFASGSDIRMKESVIDGALAIVGPHAPGDRPNPFLGADVAALEALACSDSSSDDSDAGSGRPRDLAALASDEAVRCLLDALAEETGELAGACRDVCLGKDDLVAVAKLVYEYGHRGDFELAFPPLQHLDDGLPTRLDPSAHSELWLRNVAKVAQARTNSSADETVAAVLASRTQSQWDALVGWAKAAHVEGVCRTRGHCNKNGACVAGRCVCDGNWRGRLCGTYAGPGSGTTVLASASPAWIAAGAVACAAIIFTATGASLVFPAAKQNRLKVI